MFIQHSSPLSSQLPTQFVSQNDDFELFIQSKSGSKITGFIRFAYLEEPFEMAVVITPHSIQMIAQQAFEGIQLNAPLILAAELETAFYLLQGTLTQKGQQNIVWLMLDFIHLYNLLRLKPAAIIEVYRAAFGIAKTKEPNIVFGKIDICSPNAVLVAKVLAQQWKRVHKYQFGNDLDLLACVQHILTNYPIQLCKSKGLSIQQQVIL